MSTFVFKPQAWALDGVPVTMLFQTLVDENSTIVTAETLSPGSQLTYNGPVVYTNAIGAVEPTRTPVVLPA